MTNLLPEHSPLGASGLYRWMPAPYGGGCTASVQLARGLADQESEYATEGTTAHHVFEACMIQQKDAWEFIGTFVTSKGIFFPPAVEPEEGIIVTKEMADAVQVFLDDIRKRHPDQNQSNTFAEYSFHRPKLHPLFYGRADFVYIDDDVRTLHVYDYKHGAGIVVDVKQNPQCMYYACGVLDALGLWDKIDLVVLHITQPRGWHHDGPLRSWAINTDDLWAWLYDILLPAMSDAETSEDLVSGEHCRFCPVRYHACPQTMADFAELEELMDLASKEGGAKALSNAQVGRLLQLFDVAKIVAKAAQQTAFVRLESGKKVPGQKLVNSRTNREWKDDAEKACKKKFGQRAYTNPALLSPAQIDGLPGGTALTARYAFKPAGKLVVASESDKRVSVGGTNVKDLFKD